MAMKHGLKISSLLTLPLDAVTSTMVVLGGKGMGKTNLGGVLVEELSAAELKWAVLDPMGVWWGIRHAADGKGNGLPCLILGGAHGDIPIEPTGGAVVADLVADERVNAVIDISRKANGEMWSISERIRFANDYGKQLFRRQGSLIDGRRREPMMQVIDEAARFIPQMIRAGQPELAMCASTWSTIVEEGRNVGLGVTLLTQRSARLNKDVAELADAMLAFRTIGPNSLGAVTDWLSSQVSKDELKQMAQNVRSLSVGSCLVVSPGWLKVEQIVPIRMRETFDSSATPKPGQQVSRVRGAGAKPDLGKYADRMRETIERAKEDSVPELKRRIRELEAKAAKPAVTAVAQPGAVNTIAVDALKEENKKLRAANGELRQTVDQRQRKSDKLALFLEKTVTSLRSVLDDFKADVAAMSSLNLAPMPASPVVMRQPAAAPIARGQARATTPTGGGIALIGKPRQIAAIAAGYAQRGEGVDKKLMAVLLGVATNGTFYNRISEARIAGAIYTNGAMIHATDDGMKQYAGEFNAPTTTDEVLALWLPKLPSYGKQILTMLVQRGGESMLRKDIAAELDVPMNGSFYNRLSEVRQTGLLVERGQDVAINRSLMFL